MFSAKRSILLLTDFYSLTRAINCNADIHTEDADFRVIFDAWDVDVFFETEAKVSAYVEGSFREFVIDDWEDFL